MRVHDPIGGPPDLNRYFESYERHFRTLGRYEFHLRRLVAGYSRGDTVDDLRRTFSFVVHEMAAQDEKLRAEFGEKHRLLAHRGRFAELFRDALVLLSFALCLRVPRAEVEIVLRCCDRGDPLIERLARAAAPGSEAPIGAPAFYPIFDALYDSLTTSDVERERLVRNYLDVWYPVKMEGFAFKDEHLLRDQPDYVGYWCFEAAGVTTALDIDDAGFIDHPHYPRDLVVFYRSESH